MSYFEYYETKADGTPSEQPRNIAYEDRRILFLRWKWSRVDLQHFIDLACACPGTPVDVTHWEKGNLIYSARMTYKIEGKLEGFTDRTFGQPHHGHDAHELIDGSLVVEADGVVARCVCGWTSGPRFSGMIASNAFNEHKENAPLDRTAARLIKSPKKDDY